jgi:hypothetical protein
MKTKLSVGLLSLLFASAGSAQSLYYVGSDAQETTPLKWVVGLSAFYDDNVSAGGFGPEEGSGGLNPYVGLSFVNITPQTTWDVYARLGMIYYFDAPPGVDDANSQSRLGVDFTHRFSERLRVSSRNFVSYELNPDYSYGYASSAQTGEYFFWQSDNSLGYRWTERVATYTGFKLSGVTYDNSGTNDNDQMSWELYNQFRYQFGPQTVLTLDYRYSETIPDGNASEFADQFLLAGAEHRFSPNTIGIIRAGAQFRNVDGGEDYTSPYVEFAVNSQVNQQLTVRGYTRYGLEGYDTVQFLQSPVNGLVEYEETRVLRMGVGSDYAISNMFSVFAGVDLLPTWFRGGQSLASPAFGGDIPDLDQTIYNINVGMSLKFNDLLTGTLTYNFTDSTSDIDGQDYDRNRINVGLTAEF